MAVLRNLMLAATAALSSSLVAAKMPTKAEGLKWLEDKKKEADVITLPSGLAYKVWQHFISRNLLQDVEDLKKIIDQPSTAVVYAAFMICKCCSKNANSEWNTFDTNRFIPAAVDLHLFQSSVNPSNKSRLASGSQGWRGYRAPAGWDAVRVPLQRNID